VRWFPDGKPGKRAADDGTDVAWLGCAIAWLSVDVLAVQEIKNNERAQRAMDEVRRVLDRLTNGRWAIELDRCPNPHGQHVGILYDSRRVSMKHVAMLPSLNPHGEACKDSLRPGLGGYLKFPGGLDLHLVAVHAKSGSERRSADLRLESLRGIDAAVQTLGTLDADSDIVLAGDFNTMGCKRCSPSVSAVEELATTDRLLAGASTPMRRVPANAPCSEFYGRGGTLLDHFVVSRSLSELDPATRAVVSGLCGESACAAASPKKTEFVKRLSDHCPVVLDLRDQDAD